MLFVGLALMAACALPVVLVRIRNWREERNWERFYRDLKKDK